MESLLGEAEVWTRQTKITDRKGHNFCSDRWITLNFLQEFSKVFFHAVAMEKILGEEEVWTRQTKITGKKGHNFWFERGIMLKFLQVFPKVIYLGVAMESLLGEEKVWTCHDTIKELMSYPKCRSVKVINNPARPGSNHMEVNYINYK